MKDKITSFNLMYTVLSRFSAPALIFLDASLPQAPI